MTSEATYREGLAWVDISEDLLRSLLHYPYNARIIGLELDSPAILGRPCTLRFLFASPDLPSCEPNALIPQATPTITAVHRQQLGSTRAEEYVWDWCLS